MAAHSAISFVLSRLGKLLEDEAALLLGVHDEVEWMHEELDGMQSYLEDAYAKRRRRNDRAKRWERAVRDVSYRAEDIIEYYMFKIIRWREESVKCCWILQPVETCARELKPRHKLGGEIKKLKAKINQINENIIKYDLAKIQNAPNSATYTVRRTFPQRSDNVVVGFDDHKQKILQDLLNTGITRRRVKSIVGMGGLGKTTLAKMVFDDNEIQRLFHIHARMSVSQGYTQVHLFTIKGEQVALTEFQGLDESALKDKISRLLSGERYFITLDDVWKVEDWRQLVDVFPDNENGSRVLVTTRHETVAKFADRNPYHLPHLGEEESWQLFLRTAFPSDHGTEQKICPVVLEGVAKSLVEKCCHLPLALEVLGALMSTKSPTAMAWKKVDEQMDWASIENGENCLNVLALSCNDLPDNLFRSCFQYLAIFPVDEIIKTSQVIELWIAEGFITLQENHIMEDTAEKYLNEFAVRSMIQVIDKGFDGSVKHFRVHEIFRELCLKEAREGGLLDVRGTKTDPDSIAEKNPIRLAIQDVEHISLSPNLRSLSIFHGSVKTWEPIDRSKKLKVLNVDNFTESLSLKGMYFLRYLRIANKITELPSIKDLCNLQTLDVSNTSILQLPEELCKIDTLRHIYGTGRCLLPPNIRLLKRLRTLYGFSAQGGWIEQSLAKLSELRKLCIIELETTQEKVLVDALQKLKHLSCLELSWAHTGSMSAEFIRALSSNLFELKLSVKVRELKLPGTIEFPQYLTILELHETELEEDPMATLEQLPNLASLTLGENSYVRSQMVCNSGGFLRLEELILTSLHELTSLSVAEGAMPKLAYVSIRDCIRLNDLPMGLENLLPAGSFAAFDRNYFRLDFRRRIEEDHGKDLWKLALSHYKTAEGIAETAEGSAETADGKGGIAEGGGGIAAAETVDGIAAAETVERIAETAEGIAETAEGVGIAEGDEGIPEGAGRRGRNCCC